MREAYFRRLEHEQRPQAVLLWRVFNYLRGEHDEPTSYEEIRQLLGYLPAPKAVPPLPPPAPLDELKQRLSTVALLHLGLYGDNGAHDGQG